MSTTSTNLSSTNLIAGLSTRDLFALDNLRAFSPGVAVCQESDARTSGGAINAQEIQDGTEITISVAGGGARVGDRLRVVIDGSIAVDHILTANDINGINGSSASKGIARVTVTAEVLLALSQGAHYVTSQISYLSGAFAGMHSRVSLARGIFNIDTVGPDVVVTSLGDDLKTAAEATDPAGIMTVQSEANATSTVTFVGQNGQVIKNITHNGTAKPVVLTAADLVTLGNGPVEVTTVTLDKAGNIITSPDAADGDFTLDTIAAVAVADVVNATEDVVSTSANVGSNDTNKDGSETYSLVGSATGLYGTLVLGANGAYTYTRTANLDAIQATVADTFTYKVTDAAGNTTQSTLKINMAPVNDAAVISGNVAGAVTEAGGVANAIAGIPTASGTLTSTDVDGTVNAFTAVASGTASTSGYGTYAMTAGGVWTYTLNNANTTVQALAAAATLTDTFTVTAADGTPKVITVTITGSNDTATITGTATGAVIENDAVNAVGGTLTISDVDTGQAVFQTPASLLGTYGSFTLNTITGVWAYTLDNTKPAVQALIAGQQVTDSLLVKSQDGTATQNLVVTITGTNDATLISGITTGNVIEAGGVANAIAGTPTSTGTLIGTDVNGQGLAFTAVAAGTTSTGGYGTYSMTAAGVWAYSLNNSNTAVQALATGITLTDTFTVSAVDGTTKVISVTITGTNDAAIISGAITGAILEGVVSRSGTLTSTDVDGTANAFTAVAAGTTTLGGYGTYALSPAGVWTYNLNNANATVQALSQGATLNDTFTVAAADGTQQVVTVTITGTNTAAVISGTTTGSVIEAGGVANAIAGTPTATGTLTSIDVDGVNNAFTAVTTSTTSTSGYGAFTMTAAGVWTYTLDNSNTTVQALAASATLTDTFTVTAADGTAKVVTVTITGANDAPVVAAAIPDQIAVLGTPFSYTLPAGTFSDPDGTLTYTVTRGDGTALPTWVTFNAATRTFSGTPTDTIDFNIKVTASDGTASISDAFLVGIAPVASSAAITSSTGIQNNFLNEGDTVTATVNFGEKVYITGTPQITLNLGGTLVQADYVSGSGTNAIAFSYTILAGQTDANGISINANSLNLNGGTLKDAVGNNATQNFALVADNISYKVDTSAPVAVADVNSGTEDITTLTGSVATNDTSKDGSETYAMVGSAMGTKGNLVLNTNGSYTYTRTTSADEILANLDETFTYSVTDAAGNTTQSTLKITLTPVNDAAVISGNVAGAVTEAGGVANAIAGAPTATGTLTSTDVDGAPNSFIAALAGSATAGGYGTYAMTAAGVWTYTLNNANTTVQALAAGATLNDTFTVNAADGTPKVVTVTITGANDAAVIAGTSTGAITEDAPTNTASGTLTVTDVDAGQAAFQTPASLVGTYGTYTLDTTTGAWGYTLDNTKASVQALAAGQQVTDTLVVKSQDGTDTKNVVVTVTGVNDAPIVANLIADTAGLEGTALSYTLPANAFTDVDNPTLSYTFAVVDANGTALATQPTWLSFNAATSTFSGTPPAGAAGTVFVKVTASDGSLSANDTFNIVVTAPDNIAPTLVGSNPSDNGFMMAVGNNIILNFSEAVAKGTGLIQLFKADGTLVQSFDAATSPLVTGWGGNNLTINPTANLLASTGYYIKVAPTAVKDLAGNAYAGIADATTLNFTTADASGAIGVPVNGIMAIEDLSTIGDFNGDGYDDFIVGAGINGSSQGAAFVVYGNANGTVPNLSAGSIAASAGFKIVSGQTGDYLGIAVNSAGDTNGDGLADLVVTAKYGDASSRESAYVVFGKSNASTVFATGLNVGTGFTASMGYQLKLDESYWGHAVSNAGDVNGDGLSDLLVTSDANTGREVFVIYGKTGNQSITLTSYTQFTPDMGYNVLSTNVTDLGQSVYGAGDVNGDGLADFIVGAPNSTTGQRGMVYVVYGNSTGTSVQLNATDGIAASQGFRILGDTGNNSSYSRFGFAVSSAGDVNGDGLADVMISSPYQPGTVGGAVYVVYGNSSGNVLDIDLANNSGLLAASRGFQISSALVGDFLGPYGKDIASAGDINGDGLSDMIISGRDDNGSTAASTYVVYGNASGTNVGIDASGNIAASNGFKLKGAVGFAVASAGDINGDGLNDLLVSARLGSTASYNVVLGGTQWVTAALDGAGTFAGTSGSEALIGSSGNDTITGGGGVDRFFAGRGDDTTVLTASDIANLQNNSTGQTAKTTVSGGTGFDTIRLSGGASLDLLKVSNAAAMGIDETSRIEGIERIDMATDTAANVLNISNKDVNDMAGFNQIRIGSASADGKTWTNVSGSALSNITSYHQMVVDGGSNDSIALTANGGAWANVGTVNNGSANYTVYQNNATHSQVLVQQGVTVDTQAPTLLWSTPADNDYVNTANLGNNITLQFSENVVKGNGFIQLWNKTTGQPVQAFDVSSSTLVTGWGTSTLTINPTANLAAATDYFIKISDNAIQDSAGLAYSGMNSDLQLNFSTQSANSSYAVPSSFTSAASTDAYLRSVGTAGDFNGDGYDDLLVGVAGSTQSGVYVIYGNALGEGLNLDKDPVMSNGVIAADQGFKIHGTDYFGTSVSGIGDVNGDGFADVLIGASSDSQGGSNAGAAFVVYGSADPAALNLSSGTIAAARGFKIVAGAGYGSMGDSVAGVGDVNGDGIGDFVIGYAGANAGAGNGAAYVVYGKTNATSLTFGTDGSIAATDGFMLTGAVSENAGFSVSGAGDVNGDGLADVIVSANGALTNADGATYVIFGGATGGDMSALVTAGKGFKVTGLTNSTGYQLGTSVSSAGDVNGDGYADLIVATDTDQSYTAAYVVYGGAAPTNVSLAASTIAAAKGFRILGNTANGAGLGQVSGAGDLNGDGFADVIVGSTNGSSYVVYGKATGAEVSVSTGTIAASQGFKLTYSTNTTSTTAKAVSFAGDFDGDGLTDLVIAEATDFGNSQTYKIVFGGTQWLTTPVIGNGAVTGTAASEAILGSTANDTLTGGGGVDRFFAGTGDDTIVLTAADVTNLANVAAGQTAKSSVNGGGGFDTLRLSGGAALNLTTISNAGAMGLEENSRIESIERIDLANDTTANTLMLAARDVKDMAGFNIIHTGSVSADGNTWKNVTGAALSDITKFHQLVVDGGSNDALTFAADTGSWTNVGTATQTVAATNSTTTYTVYQNNATNSQVLVQAGVGVTTPPVLVSSTPSDNGYMLTLTNNITMTFDQVVQKGTGTIGIYKTSDNTLLETAYDVVSSGLVTGWGTNTLTINPTANLTASTGYYVKVSNTAVKNAAGATFTGINDATTLNFSTAAADGSVSAGTSYVGAGGSNLGFTVSGAGDVNGDGFGDYLVGAHETHSAFVVYGNASGLGMDLAGGTIPASKGFKISGGYSTGYSVSGVGDVNGDGYDDVLVGMRSSTFVPTAYVVYGNSIGTNVSIYPSNEIPSSLGFTISGAPGSYVGYSVSGAGDVNGDGLADLVVGGPGSGGVPVMYVVYGRAGSAAVNLSSATIAASDGFKVTSRVDSGFGSIVSGAGDVNGDGLADVIVGANIIGSAYVIYGNSTGTAVDVMSGSIAAGSGFRIVTAQGANSFGLSVSGAGDVNGDGLADVMVGDRVNNSVYVVYGNTMGATVNINSTGGIAASSGFRIAGTSDSLGFTTSAVGDVNGDGLADVLVGPYQNVGYAYVVYGNASGSTVNISSNGSINASNGFKITGASTGYFAYSLSGAGDINGDGLSDLIMGSLGNGYSLVLGGTQWVTSAVTGTGTVTGGTGAEAIIGSAAADTLTGGGGVDRFFAGQGNDTIVLTASDVTNLANNTTGQTAKATVSGGGGFDTIRLSGGAGLNLSSISNSGGMGLEENSRIESIERIDLATDTTANALVLAAKDVKDMAGFNLFRTGSASADGKTWTNVNGGTALSASTAFHQLQVDGGNTDSLVLNTHLGVWTNAGTVNNGTSNYTVYQNDATDTQVLVQAGVSVVNAPVMLASSNPVANGYLIALGNNLSLTFDQAVLQGTGTIQLFNSATGALVEGFDVASSSLVTGWGTSTLTINPTADLTTSTSYHLKVTDNAVQNAVGSTFAGMADATTYRFSTAAADGSVAASGIAVQANSGTVGVTSAGDVNGDGFDDDLVNVGSTNTAYVIYGNATGTPADLSAGTVAASKGFKISTYAAMSASGGGDFNGDGLDDLLVTSSGNTFVVYGSSNAAYTGVNLSSATPSIASSLGYQIATGGQVVSGAGDVNGDGFADFITGGANGNIKVIFGAASGVTPSVTGFNITSQSHSVLGYIYSLSGAGDVNGDGYADIIVGNYPSARAFVIYGNSAMNQSLNLNTNNPAPSAGFTISYASGSNENLGHDVSSAGDVNGDGLADLLVTTSNSVTTSSVYVVYGNSSGTNVSITPGSIAPSHGFVISGPTGSWFGSRASSAGDVNGDGLADVIVQGRSGDPGFAYVVYGNTSGTSVSVTSGSIAASQGFKVTGSSLGQFATTVSNAGDINGDGLADLIVGGNGAGATYSVILGGTQWVSNAVSGTGTVTGTSAAEAIIGSAAADTLTGGGGVDRFFAGMGNDTIVLAGTDVTNLSAPTGATRGTIHGGGGFDTLQVSAAGVNLNLTTVSNAGAMGLEENSRIESIERIDLGADTVANTLTLTARDVKDMAGFNLIRTGSVSADGNMWTGSALGTTTKFHQLVVNGTASDTLVLSPDAGFWTNAGTANNGTDNYTVYQNAGTNSQVLVKSGVVVTNNDSVAPVVLDLNRDGQLSYGQVTMDVNGDGQLDHTAWAGAQDGVLVWDKYQDGVVHDNSQYAFTQYGGKTDLQGLAAAFDTNHDGEFDARDAKFSQFSVWQDANQNGVSDVGEVHTLAEAGIASVHLTSDGVARNPADGVHEAGRTTATTTDGQNVLVADAAFEFHTAAAANLLRFDDVLPAPDWQAHDITSAHVSYSLNSTSALTDELMHRLAV
ncbi:VCBS repeat [Burkholderiaceae bacterium]